MRSRSWNSAIARELCQSIGTSDPQMAIRQLAIQLLCDAEVTTFPVNLPLVASFQRVIDIQEVVMAHAGRLIPKGGNYVIQINSRHSDGKKRFTICHELGHALIPAYQRQPHTIEDMKTGIFQEGTEEEHLCDIAAAELLMPTSLFLPRAVNLGHHLNAVIELARTFKASREAVAIRLVQMNIRPCAVALWHLTFKRSETHINNQYSFFGPEWTRPEKKLRLKYAVTNALFGHYLPRDISAPLHGYLDRCFRDGGIVCGEERLKIGRQEVALYALAVARDFDGQEGATREILSLLLSDGTVPSNRDNQAELWVGTED